MKNSICTLFLVLAAHRIHAQQTLALNQSILNPFYLNPAAAAFNYETVINCHYKKNWIGMPSSPEKTTLTFESSPKNHRLGGGVILQNDKAGFYSFSHIQAAIRYQLKISEQQFFACGIKGGVSRFAADLSQIKAQSPDEFQSWHGQPVIIKPGVSAGIFYHFGRTWISLSVEDLMQVRYTLRKKDPEPLPVHNQIAILQFAAQTRLILTPSLELIPAFLLRSNNGLAPVLELQTFLSVQSNLLFGLGIRGKNTTLCTFGLRITEKMRFTYSFEYSSLNYSNTGSGHEIGLRFTSDKKPRK